MRTVKRSSQDDDRDEGAVLILVALLMVALIGMGALVVDLGALYAEKRELQNGADAGALAVAQDCGQGNCALNGTPISLAGAYANRNANDSSSAVDLVCGVGPGLAACSGGAPPGAAGATGWVRVDTSTRTSDGGDQVDFLLAPVMNGLAGATVRASAVAAWGRLGGASVLPFTISECSFLAVGGNLSTGSVPSTLLTIYSKAGQGNSSGPATNTCPSSPPGGTVAGNFGWFNPTSNCYARVGDQLDANTGANDELDLCDAEARIRAGEDLVVPIFNTVLDPNGTNARYVVAGFAGFHVTAYHFPGNSFPTRNWRCPPLPGPGNGNLLCFQGYFTRVVSDGEFGGGNNYGALAVKMVG